MSGLFTFILVVHCILALALVVIVLLQRSEGGVLGIGGSSSGLMTARGAADLLTTSTRWLATAFIITSISLAVVAARDRKGSSSFVEELDKKAIPVEAAPVRKANPLAPDVPVPSVQLPGAPAPDLAPPGSASATSTPVSLETPAALPPGALTIPKSE
jgi:preprotein translocase subunit SecG